MIFLIKFYICLTVFLLTVRRIDSLFLRSEHIASRGFVRPPPNIKHNEIVAQNFNQKLDHFNESDSRFWNQASEKFLSFQCDRIGYLLISSLPLQRYFVNK